MGRIAVLVADVGEWVGAREDYGSSSAELHFHVHSPEAHEHPPVYLVPVPWRFPVDLAGLPWRFLASLPVAPSCSLVPRGRQHPI